jgi:hypothetical protein
MRRTSRWVRLPTPPEAVLAVAAVMYGYVDEHVYVCVRMCFA